MPVPSFILDIKPDWGREPEITYSFLSALQDTPYLVQQRRPIVDVPIFSASYKFMNVDEDLQRLRNTLIAAKGSLLLVPIFTEIILASSIVAGGSAITATTDLSTCWNIQNASYVLLLDPTTGQSEALEIANLAGQQIAFATNITKTWVAARTEIYPAFAASLTSMKESNATDSVGSIEADFEEATLSAEATGENVGEEQKACCTEGGIVLPWTFISLTSAPFYKYDPSGIMTLGATSARVNYPGGTHVFCQGRVTTPPSIELGPIGEFRFRVSIISLGSGLTPYPGTYMDFSAITFTDNIAWQNVSLRARIYADRLVFIADSSVHDDISAYINFPLPITVWFRAIWDNYRPRFLMYRDAGLTDFIEELTPGSTGHPLYPTLYAMSFCTVSMGVPIPSPIPSVVAEVTDLQWQLYDG